MSLGRRKFLVTFSEGYFQLSLKDKISVKNMRMKGIAVF